MSGSVKGRKHPGYPKHKIATLAVLEGCQRAREARSEKMEERKQKFLEIYHNYPTLKEVTDEVGVTPSSVFDWCDNDEEFAQEYQRLKRIKDAVQVEALEEFLYKVALGEVKCDRTTGISMANVVANKMSAAARKPERWSEKFYTEKKETKSITTVVFHTGGGKDVIDLPPSDVKVLNAGS